MAGNPEDTRNRLERFMMKYNPDKVNTVDQILKAYAGKEQQMFEALVKKYGPEPPREDDVTPPPAESPSPASGTGEPQVDVVAGDNEADAAVVPHTEEQRRALFERLTRFLTKYDPEKLAGVDALIDAHPPTKVGELFQKLEEKYGPEVGLETSDEAVAAESSGATGMNADADDERTGDNRDTSTAQLVAFLAEHNMDAAQCAQKIFGGDQELLAYAQKVFGDYENRIKRLFVRYDPGRLGTEEQLLVAHANQLDELLASLTTELGEEPPKSAPTRFVRLLSRRRDVCRPIDEETWTDEDIVAEEAPKEVPTTLKEGYKLIATCDEDPPGDFSGDESKAYPKDEESWYRLFLQRMPAFSRAGSTASMNDARSRVFTEATSDLGGSDGETPNQSPRGGYSNTPRGGAPVVTLGNRYGEEIGSLCMPCSGSVVKAFHALWQPVGHQYQQLLSETVVKDGYLEKLSSGTRRSSKWQRRHVRVNDKGLHYFETNSPSEKPKGYKLFTRSSMVIEDVDVERFPKCSDTRYHYFVITVNETNEPFQLRASSLEEKRQWVSFLKLAIARVRLTTVGKDQNPSRWRARVRGLRNSNAGLIELAETSSQLITKLKKQKMELEARLHEERLQQEITRTQTREMEAQQAVLVQRIAGAKERAMAAEEEADAKCIDLAEETAVVRQTRLDMESALDQTRRNIDRITETVVQLQCEIINYEHECEAREASVQTMFTKWRRCEERSPQSAPQRAERHESIELGRTAK